MTDHNETWVDGIRTRDIPATDRGLAYGDGVFETMRAEDGRVRLLPRHLDRLSAGAARLGFAPPARAELEQAIATACAVDAGPAVLKLIVTRGDSARGYRPPEPAQPRWILKRLALPPVPQAIAVRWCDTRLARQPKLAGIKHLNRLEQVLARSEWGDQWDDGLMCDTAGAVVAATRANLFVVAGGALATPSLEQAGVAGIMREMVCEAARALDMTLTIRPMSRDDVVAADEWFLCNAIHGVMPVRRLAELERDAPGPVTTRLKAWVEAHD